MPWDTSWCNACNDFYIFCLDHKGMYGRRWGEPINGTTHGASFIIICRLTSQLCHRTTSTPKTAATIFHDGLIHTSRYRNFIFCSHCRPHLDQDQQGIQGKGRCERIVQDVLPEGDFGDRPCAIGPHHGTGWSQYSAESIIDHNNPKDPTKGDFGLPFGYMVAEVIHIHTSQDLSHQ
jgi:hypothetical protein